MKRTRGQLYTRRIRSNYDDTEKQTKQPEMTPQKIIKYYKKDK